MAAIADNIRMITCTVLPRCYALLAVTPPPPPPPPPPSFGRNYCIGLFDLHYTPPPRAARAALRCCSSCTCTRVASVEDLYLCIKRVENSLRTGLGLFRGFLRPSSCRRGRWAESGYETTCYVLQHVRGQQLFHPSVLPQHVDRRSSRLLPHYRVRKFVGGGGGLNCEAKAQVLVVTPPPSFS